jgi:hypothetical protein
MSPNRAADPSTPRWLTVAVAAVLAVALTGCVYARDEALKSALQGYAYTLPTIEKPMSQIVSTSATPADAAAKIAAGDMNVGYVFPTPIPTDARLPGNQFVIPRDIKATASSVQVDFVVGSYGEIQEGMASAQRAFYVCLRFSAKVPGDGSISIVDALCPPEIQMLIDASPGLEKLTAKDIPYLADRANP